MARFHPQLRSNGNDAPGARGRITSPGAPRLVIDTEQSIVGDISFSGTVQIDGKIEGDVSGNRVVIGPGAVVDGAVKGRSVYIDGTVTGPIDSGAISLASTAYVKGNITYETMTIASGASVVGLCRDRNRIDQEEPQNETPAVSHPLPFNKIGKAKTAGRPRSLEATNPAEPASRAKPQPPQSPQSPMTMRAVWDAIQESDETALS